MKLAEVGKGDSVIEMNPIEKETLWLKEPIFGARMVTGDNL
jgi:hypothetical protein